MLYPVFLLLKEAHCIKLIVLSVSKQEGTSPCCKLSNRGRKQTRRKCGPFNNAEIFTVVDLVQCLNNLNMSPYVKKNLN